LAPCDFWLWGDLKSRVYKRKPKNLTQLKNVIIEEFDAIPLEHCQNACRSVLPRLNLCMEKGGAQIRRSKNY